MANNYTTKIKGLFYDVHEIDYTVWCAFIFPAIPTNILKRASFQ